MRRPRSARSRWWKSVLRSALITLVVGIVGFALVAFIGVNIVLNQISRPDLEQEYVTEEQLMEIELQEAIEHGETEETVVYPELDPAEIQWTKPEAPIGKKQELINILLIGQDSRSISTAARSDSMILVSINLDAKTITMTSFLRDLYVQIPGYQDNRINASYAFGGMKLLNDTLETNFGVTVDGNVAVSFDVFAQVIDLLGGVDINLTNAEANYFGRSPGLNHLDGKAALGYARLRAIDSDFGRTQRQRNVMTALFYSLRSVGITQLLDLTEQILPMISTDMTNAQIMTYAAKIAPILSSSSISGSHIPAEGTYTFNSVRGMSVIVADLEQNREILRQALEPEATE